MRLLFTLSVCLAASVTRAAEPPEWSMGFDAAINNVLSIDREGENGVRASRGAQHLATLPPDAIFWIFEDFPKANPLAANLLRAAVETIADRAADKGKSLPTERLEGFAANPQNDSRARRLAYELALRSDPSVKDRLIPGMLADPSPEFRRDAVAHWITEAERLKAAGDADAAEAAYRKALSGAVYDDQVRAIAKALEEYGETIDIQDHFGFITEWKIIGPFDNRGMKGFEAVYPPEQEVNFDAAYDGQLGEVRWQPISTDDPFGEIDIAKQIENYKGSAMYLAVEFGSPTERQVEIRLGTPNAWKLWVNGEFLFGREEYHRGMELDQYRVPATLKPGRNVILFKILQNEQSDDWAQSYKFRLRVCDPTGVAVLPAGSAMSE